MLKTYILIYCNKSQSRSQNILEQKPESEPEQKTGTGKKKTRLRNTGCVPHCMPLLAVFAMIS